MGIAASKSAATPLSLFPLKVRHWGFLMRYFMTLYLKGLQNYRLSNFEQLDFSPFTTLVCLIAEQGLLSEQGGILLEKS